MKLLIIRSPPSNSPSVSFVQLRRDRVKLKQRVTKFVWYAGMLVCQYAGMLEQYYAGMLGMLVCWYAWYAGMPGMLLCLVCWYAWYAWYAGMLGMLVMLVC